MIILSVGEMKDPSSTCLLRHNTLERIAKRVDKVSVDYGNVSFLYRLCFFLFRKGFKIPVPGVSGENRQIKRYVDTNSYDIVWIDKGLTINPTTLKHIKKHNPHTKIVSFSLDNMSLRHNQSENFIKCIPLYDYIFTTKSDSIDRLYKLGAQRVEFVNQAYDDQFHYPRELSKKDYEQFESDVGFIGSWEQERMESILFLTRNGIHVKVYGDEKWKICDKDNVNLEIVYGGLHDEDYVKAIKCFKISLCFLRKMNFDQQTSRTMEIPACGGFMIAERTSEHQQLFCEDKEAVFFSDNDELLRKCQYYLDSKHEKERLDIIFAGNERCIDSGYSYYHLLNNLISQIMENNEGEK